MSLDTNSIEPRTLQNIDYPIFESEDKWDPEESQAHAEVLQKLQKVCPTPYKQNGMNDAEKVIAIEGHITQILSILGLELKDDSLRDTPKRIAKMYVHELFSGLKPENFPKIMTLENKMNFNDRVTVSSIRVLSTCEHHFAMIDGFATVSYIPQTKIIGLSKINRIVKYFSRRPQVQERLTKQIADMLELVLETKDVAVHIQAKHYCVISRGVEDTDSKMDTSDLRGRFCESQSRAEFLASIPKK